MSTTSKNIVATIERIKGNPNVSQAQLIGLLDTIARELNAFEESVDPDGNPGTLKADTITEYTADSGTTVEGVLIKDNVITGATETTSTTINATTANLTKVVAGAGTVSSPGSVVGANDNGLYEVSATQLGVSIGNTLVGGFNASGAFANVISEQTAAAGVTVDGVLLKDAAVNTDTINESTPAAGVTVDGVLLKDAGVTGTTANITTITTNVAAANLTISGTTLAAAGTDANIQTNINSKGTGGFGFNANVLINADGSFSPVTLADAAAANNTIYFSSDSTKLVYKDGAAAVHDLY